ncbi:auxin-responsive protein IAA27-like [Mercurialis annua]|uniref:auxin-responsive protein IAA27-like n=1 Tax=Mercurialis annua TaxID=3986 RepID=UPI002160288A|nr:auxin-responsive protein IAA27-like [Mercurialis annua]
MHKQKTSSSYQSLKNTPKLLLSVTNNHFHILLHTKLFVQLFQIIFAKLMSSIPKEHDYIGLSETTSMENISACLNLKETELRLGLPGSQSPDRKPLSLSNGVSLFGKDIETNCPLKNLVSGAKRGFSDAIITDGSCKNWVFSGSNGSNVELNSGNNNGSTTHKSSADGGGGGGVIVQSSKPISEKNSNENCSAPAAKARVVGWPPIRSFRKNTMVSNVTKDTEDAEGKSGSGCLYVKVSMDGAPYLRKVDLNTYSNYTELSSGLEKMFSCFTIGQCGSHGLRGQDGLNESCLKDLLHGAEYVLTYEDKDNDWMLVGDVPWEMFTDTCRRLRIMKSSDAIGLAPRAMEKCKSRN